MKALPKTSNQPYVCRCCNSGFANNPIDLFGLKAESENLLDLLNNLTGLKFCDSGGCPRRICRKCYKRLKQFSEFKTLCLNSRSNQEMELRLKRGGKVSESQSVALQREAKRGKGDDQVERSKPSPMKSLQFALIYPKEKLNEVAQPERESDLGKQGRILPQSIRPVSTQTQYDEGVEFPPLHHRKYWPSLVFVIMR